MTICSRSGIDGRIGDLGELLAEVVVEGAHLARQHRHRRVVTHGADRLLAAFGQHADHLVALLEGDLEQLLVDRQIRRGTAAAVVSGSASSVDFSEPLWAFSHCR